TLHYALPIFAAADHLHAQLLAELGDGVAPGGGGRRHHHVLDARGGAGGPHHPPQDRSAAERPEHLPGEAGGACTSLDHCDGSCIGHRAIMARAPRVARVPPQPRRRKRSACRSSTVPPSSSPVGPAPSARPSCVKCSTTTTRDGSSSSRGTS